MNEFAERTVRLIGEAAYERLTRSLVIVAGLGGVGGHCAEALARAGVGRLHIVDCDAVAPSNLNRQIIATRQTLGMRKVDAMRQRIADISDCEVSCADVHLDAETVDAALPANADFLADAIDFLPGKLALVHWAGLHGVPMVSCMGAGNRLDPSRLTICDIFETENDPLARNMRHALRKMGVASLPVVCSSEPATRAAGQREIGSFAPVTGSTGLLAAAYILRALMDGGEKL